MSEQYSERDLSDLEQALKTLVPAPVRIDRDQVLFRAGQQSAAGAARNWRAAALFFALATAGLGVGWVLRPTPEPELRIIQVRQRGPERLPVEEKNAAPEPLPLPQQEKPQPITPRQVEPIPALAHQRLQNEVMRRGLDALPHLPAETNPPPQPPPDPLLRELHQGISIARWPYLFSGE